MFVFLLLKCLDLLLVYIKRFYHCVSASTVYDVRVSTTILASSSELALQKLFVFVLVTYQFAQ